MINRDDLEAEIRAQAQKVSEITKELDEFAVQVRDYWRGQSPVDEGEYAASVQVFKKKFLVDGMPARRVGSTDFKAHWIEFGTGQPGPTKAFAPRAKTAAHFGGDEKRVPYVPSSEEE